MQSTQKLTSKFPPQTLTSFYPPCCLNDGLHSFVSSFHPVLWMSRDRKSVNMWKCTTIKANPLSWKWEQWKSPKAILAGLCRCQIQTLTTSRTDVPDIFEHTVYTWCKTWWCFWDKQRERIHKRSNRCVGKVLLLPLHVPFRSFIILNSCWAKEKWLKPTNLYFKLSSRCWGCRAISRQLLTE